MRISVLCAVAVGCAALAPTALGHGDQPVIPPRDAACAQVEAPQQSRLMRAYANAGAYRTRQVNDRRGVPRSVTVEIPRIAFSDAGASPTLPTGPCQTIYRYRYRRVHAPAGSSSQPFRYAEIDWNTEGLPRGPNESFSSAHFDFHFYLRSRAEVEATTNCVSTNGRTCDQLRTSYGQMRRFMRLPPARYVPRVYRPDVGSEIPFMGLHLLDRSFDYTLERVNHNPTLIYGTFNGRMLFAEASVTLFTLQDAMRAPGHVKSFRYPQPRDVQARIAWPQRFTIRYLPRTGGFRAGFDHFRMRVPSGR